MSLQLIVPNQIVLGYETMFVIYDSQHEYKSLEKFSNFTFIFIGNSGTKINFVPVGDPILIQGYPTSSGDPSGVPALIVRAIAQVGAGKGVGDGPDDGDVIGETKDPVGTPVPFDPAPTQVTP